MVPIQGSTNIQRTNATDELISDSQVSCDSSISRNMQRNCWRSRIDANTVVCGIDKQDAVINSKVAVVVHASDFSRVRAEDCRTGAAGSVLDRQVAGGRCSASSSSNDASDVCSVAVDAA